MCLSKSSKKNSNKICIRSTLKEKERLSDNLLSLYGITIEFAEQSSRIKTLHPKKIQHRDREMKQRYTLDITAMSLNPQTPFVHGPD